MVTTLVTLILMVTCLTCTAGQLRHAALNTRDIDTVLADDTGQDVIMMEHSGDGEHCLLTVNGRLEDIEDQGCTLRESQICSRPRCVETEAGVSVIEDRCEVSVTRVPVTDSLRVCSARGQIQCSGPCYKCPVACVKTLRTECRVGHVLRLETRVSRDTWTEEEVVGKSLDCEERDEEQLCAPINCKHVNITHVCFDQEATSTEIQLRSRRCPICKGDTEECDDVITQECDSDPLDRTWHKYCSANKQDLLQFTLNTTNAVAAQERPRSQDAVGLKQSIPIQHLNEIDTTGGKGDDESEHDVKEMTRELLDLVKIEDEMLAENMQVISNLQLHPGNINVNIKYNFVTQDETVQHKNATTAGELRTALERIESLKSDDASEDPLLRLIDNIVQTQSELPRKDDIGHNKQLQINSTPVTPGAEEIAPGTSSRLPIIAVDKDLYDATTTTTTERTQKEEEDNAVALRKNLSPADFLRMCFLHGEGCEFGLGKGSTPEPSTTPAPLTTTTATTTTTELPNNQMKLIQNRLRLCFFSNICDGSDNNIESDKVNSDNSQERRESLRQPRIIKTSGEVQHNNINNRPVTLSEKRRQTIKKLIQERARACLFHGVCN